MPRKARIDAPCALQHIIARGIERRKIFFDDTDRDDFLTRLGGVLADTQTECYAWARSLSDKPFLRKVTMRLPRALWPVPKAYGHVMAFTEDGRVVADLQDPTGAYPETTGVTETADRLYVQSLHAKGLGWLAR